MGKCSGGTQKPDKQEPGLRREIIFAAEARVEFEEAVAWYHSQQAGLRVSFETELHATFQRILQNPKRFRLVGKTIRKARVKVYSKYSVCFHVEPAFIGVVSVFHGARHPAELRRRLK
jgi:plasmid stabilization system protein ParE